MKCYNHHDRDAFAMCLTCGKGLCLDCLEEYDGTMVCKNGGFCKLKVDYLNKAYKQLSTSNYLGILFIFLSIVPLLAGFVDLFNGKGVVGGFYLLFAFLTMFIGIKLVLPNKKRKNA